MAEFLCRDMASKVGISNATISSAGIHAMPGEPLTRRATIALEHGGIVGVTHKAKRLTKALVAAATIIFVMEEHHKEAITEQFPEATSKVRLLDRVGVVDPFGQSQEMYDQTLSQIKQALVTFFESVPTFKPRFPQTFLLFPK